MKHVFGLQLLLGSLLASTFGLIPASQAAEIEEYQRKYISFYPFNQPQLNQLLSETFQQQLPRFSYQSLPDYGLDLHSFAREVYRFQQSHAGEIAAAQEVPDLRFGDKVVSWAETRRIMDSAFIALPQWHYGKLEFKNLHQKNNTWYVDLTSKLDLVLEFYKVNQGEAQVYHQLKESWEVSEEMLVSNISELASGLREASGGLADPANPLLQPLFIEAISQHPSYASLLQENPEVRMQVAAKASLKEAGFNSLIKSVKQLDAFSLKTQVESIEKSQDRLLVSLPGSETSSSLGAMLDQSYKLIEYQKISGVETPVELGFARVRQLDSQNLQLQPIILRREAELGDQLVEYPQLGVQFDLFAGTSSVGFDKASQQSFSPQGGLRIAYNLAKATGVSELYGTASASLIAPVAVSALTASEIDSSISTSAAALPLVGEIGVLKRWYLRQLILELGGQVGLMGGALLNSSLSEIPYTFSFGATALAGAAWQFSPDLIIGAQGGWRFYAPSEWKATSSTGPSTLSLPGLSSNGPVLQLYASYMF